MSHFRADLHCHSTHSDGTDTPEALIQLAVKSGLSGLSITDHDTVTVYPQALNTAKEAGLLLLPGVEFSASHYGEPIHILGYGFDFTSGCIYDFCKKHRERREKRNRNILNKLKKCGVVLQEEELKAMGQNTIGRPHIAFLLMQKKIVSSQKEAFQKYLGEGKPAYDPGESVSVEETIDCIHQAQGKAILAHPHLIQKRTIERALIKMPFDGVEGYYARLFPEQEKRWLQIGREREWIITGGSDYHGETKPHNMLGSSWVDKETFDILYAHFQRIMPSF